ncbi:hypothetical protein C7I85_22040 [Mesorhizobium soli]|uniref:Uncharacterized protein n=2 Tax=Pseudaminobacter soli (ex Li et al. 2025) TaxID=1295366 RepID=A0A2P7S590_9HYPH|nr:hypothetical protein C7I85_22040 [Mesorhizobium soli]
MIDHLVAVSVFWEIAAVGAATLAIWKLLSAARPVAVRFLANHAALVAFGAMVLAGQQSMVASVFDRVPVLEGFRLPVAIETNGVTAMVLIMGLCACCHCHFLFLSAARQRARDTRLALLAIERDL